MAGIAGATALAGCSGQGGTSTDDPGNGSGSYPGTTSDTDLTEVNITLAPDGFQGIVMDHIHSDTDILTSGLEDAGYQANVQQSWEAAALFAAGGPDFSTMSSLEAARLGVERELELVVIGKVAPLFKRMWVARVGEYDPEMTDGTQVTIDKIVEDDVAMGIGSWAGGEIPGYMTAF
jgi:hypothetical protein